MNTVVLGPVPVPAVTEEVEALLDVRPHYSLPLYVNVIRVLPGQSHPPQHRVPAETLTTRGNKKLKFNAYKEIVNSHFLHYNIKNYLPFMSDNIKINLKKGKGFIPVNDDN